MPALVGADSALTILTVVDRRKTVVVDCFAIRITLVKEKHQLVAAQGLVRGVRATRNAAVEICSAHQMVAVQEFTVQSVIRSPRSSFTTIPCWVLL
jgi:hypothetical protein